ncbi:MAG: hypothetical protein QCI38_05650, partial [Candidatus Thermoplasmatota archaeon]|nr:hypothetical protein [Candidatus Thermoplasmatota archaeon]
MSRGLGLTADQRILLLLAKHPHRHDGYEAPYDVCQKGMAENMGMLVNNVSRSLAALTDAGLVQHRLAHVRGAKRRMRAFHLTE